MYQIKLRRAFMKCCISLALATVLSACGSSDSGTTTPPPTTPPPTTTVSFAAQIQPIFTGHCVVCHTSSGSAGNVLRLDIGTYNNLVNRPSVVTDLNGKLLVGTLVIPGNSADSLLYQRVSGIGLLSFLERMPLGALGGFLSASDQLLIKTWIDQGAKNN